MTKEEKDLLFSDLCSRLPYDVKVRRIEHVCEGTIESVETLNVEWLKEFSDNVVLKPYLFPLSSMTEEQRTEASLEFNLKKYMVNEYGDIQSYYDIGDDIAYIDIENISRYIIWLNKNHFDWRGLIPKGLAIDCTNLNIY